MKTGEIKNQIQNTESLNKSMTAKSQEPMQPISKTLGKCSIKFINKNDETCVDQTIFEESYKCPVDVIKHLTATPDFNLASEILRGGVIALSNSKDLTNSLNTAIQALAESAPNDVTEARLCLQATALYSKGMEYIMKAETSELLPCKEFYMKSAIKLLRLHSETVEALNKHRRGGEQRVVVQHVNIENGGKAIVNGQMVTGGEGGDKKKSAR